MQVDRDGLQLQHYFIMLSFWVLAPCRLVGRYQHFGETYYLRLQP
jgi:hypothetical protein